MVSFPTVYKRVIAHWRAIVFLLILAFCAYPLTHPGKFEAMLPQLASPLSSLLQFLFPRSPADAFSNRPPLR